MEAFHSLMHPAENTNPLRAELLAASQQSQTSNFCERHLTSYYRGISAWLISIGDTISFSGEFLRETSIKIIHCNWSELGNVFRLEGWNLLHSLKYTVFLPSIIFAAIFFPSVLYPNLEYNLDRSEETTSSLIRDLTDEVRNLREQNNQLCEELEAASNEVYVSVDLEARAELLQVRDELREREDEVNQLQDQIEVLLGNQNN